MDELEHLYRQKYTRFCRTASAITGDAESGRDVVQETFARALRKMRWFRGDAALEAWIWRILINVAVDVRRRRKPVLLADTTTPVGPSSLDLPLHVLTNRQREVLFLHYYADLDYASIAEALGISSGTVGATLSSARDRLRPALLRKAAG
jgi:RNA polymerase sigma-70 factor, ECF subfamily